jgi:hypothetical protein
MELFFGHAEIVFLLALGLGVFAWQLESTQSIVEAIGAIACVLALFNVTGLVHPPDFDLEAAKAAIVGKTEAIPCAPGEDPKLTGCLALTRVPTVGE